MPDAQFADRREAVAYLSSELPRHFPSGLADGRQLADAIVDAFAVTAPDTGATDPLHRTVFARRRWVIRNQDLALVDWLGGILQGTATGAALIASTGSVPLAALAPAIAVLAQIIKAAMALRAKGVTLSAAEFRVLCLLRESPDGLDLVQLSSRLPAAEHPGTASVQACLDKLARYPSRSGDIPLVWKGADERWRVKDV